MESVNLSFLRRTLHTAHDRIHMLLLPQFLYKLGLSDRGFGCSGLSFDCQTNVLRMSRTQGSVTYSFFRESTPTHPTFIVPIAARPFHSEHPSVFSDNPIFPSILRSRRRQGLNALFLVFSVCIGRIRLGMAPRCGALYGVNGTEVPDDITSRPYHDSPPRLNLYPLAAGMPAQAERFCAIWKT